MVLLERDEELRVLDDLLADLDTSGGKVVLVRGEAGIGKSSLVREFIKTHADDAHVYFGSCDDLLTPQPLGPIWDVGRDEMSVLGPLNEDDRRAVMGALLSLLSRTLRPSVLVLEDTHWADEATLDVIKYLGRRIARTNGILLLTYRDGEVDYDHPLRQVIGELPPENLVRMHLDNLSKQAIADLVGDADLDVNEVLTLTDGNPLFVTEVLASGVDKVPSSVRDSVLARAAKLSTKARQALDLVSVIPSETERSLIDSILGPTEEHMTECARQDLLGVEADTVSFHHEITRRAVESALSASDRRRLNAEVLAELGGLGDLARLVHHAVGANDVESIIAFAPKAARAAMAIESYREAVAHFRILEPHLEEMRAVEHAAIVDDWARAEFYVDNAEALEILARGIDLHRASGDELALARALTFAVRLNELDGRPQTADACAAEAMAILESYPSSGELAHAISQLAWLALMRSEPRSALEFANRAIALAETNGEELAAIYALNSKGYAIYVGGDPGGFEFLEEARRRAELTGDAFEETRALINMAALVSVHKEVERFVDLALRARDTAARYEIRALEGHAYNQYAEALQWKGEWTAAEDAASEAALATNQYTMTYAEMVLGTLLTRQGRPEARATLDRNWARAETSREMQVLCPAATARAEYMWLTDEDDPRKVERFREVLDEVTARGADAWRSGLLAFWLWKLGELSEIPEGIAEPYRQIMEGKAEDAAAIFQTKGIPYERALALMHGDKTARLEALEIFETLGATPIAAKLRKALRDDGVALPRGKGRDTRRHAAGLTARQAEVLQLLDEGLSNIEIADRLFVSPRTVENHVSAVLTKLDSSTRDEAVSRARSVGLLTTAL